MNSWKVCDISGRKRCIKLAKKKNIPIEIIIELHEQGLYDKEIAEILKCGRTNIVMRLNKVGYVGRKGKLSDIDLRNRISSSLIGRYVGENNPNYKGYISEKSIARGIFKTISKRMLRERNYTCEICNKKGGDLETHHIRPFADIFDEFISCMYSGEISKLYEEILNFEPFIDESNLMVVCHDCHWEIHYTDNHELSPFRWESATTIESISDEDISE